MEIWKPEFELYVSDIQVIKIYFVRPSAVEASSQELPLNTSRLRSR